MSAIIAPCQSQAQMAVTVDGKPQNIMFQCGKLINHMGAHEVYLSWPNETAVTENAVQKEG